MGDLVMIQRPEGEGEKNIMKLQVKKWRTECAIELEK